MSGKPSVAGRRMASLRRTAYAVVDERSGMFCELKFSIAGVGVERCLNVAVQHHHRRPRRSGGSTDPATETAANIVHLCAAHHEYIESSRRSAYALGLLILAGHDPATTPVLLHVGWVLLNDEGTYTPTKETL